MPKVQMNGRWHVAIVYHNPRFTPDFHDIEELEELQDIVERGRDWNEIQKIEVRLIRKA